MMKKIAKQIVNKDHWLFLSWYRYRFGFFPAVLAYVKLLCRKGLGVAPNPLTNGSVFLRPGTADQNVYEEIFLSNEYDLDLGEPRIIIDAGAHIGLSSVYFASRYPDARIIAVEPEPSNFEILLKNAENHGQIKPVQAGLWSKRTSLRIQNVGAATWSFRVVEEPSGSGIPAVGIPEIMADFNIQQIDVLKIDIEGSEFEVLKNSDSWISSVKTLIIELHDRYQPGCSEALSRALSGYSYEKSRSGESFVISNLRRLPRQHTDNHC